MEDTEKILRDVFGDSSSESEGTLEHELDSPSAASEFVCGETRHWEQISPIDGLWLCRDFLSSDQQASLLSAINREGWFREASGNQAMRFGDLPGWAIELSNSIRELVFYSDNDNLFESMDKKACRNLMCFPSDLLWREPLFDQLIANKYQPGEGICAHVDLLRFEDGIAIISLESSCVMHFSRVDKGCHDNGGEEDAKSLSSTKIPVLLIPGSLVLMWGEARYLWKHEINRNPGFQMWEGQELNQQKRTSITLRKLCQAA